MDSGSVDICQFVKEDAPLFSEKLLAEFKRVQSNKEEDSTVLKRPMGTHSDLAFTNDPLFYFTISQERKLQSTLEGLRLKGESLSDLMKKNEIIAIKEMDKLPKERTRHLLQFLNDELNPISVKIRQSLNEVLMPLSEAKILTTYDSHFEEDWLSCSLKINSTRDLEKIKNAFKIFSYEDFKKILEGSFDV
jgi:hypothetical protein